MDCGRIRPIQKWIAPIHKSNEWQFLFSQLYITHRHTHTRHGTEMPLAHSAFEKERNERVPMCNAVRSPSDGRQYFLLCIHHTILM